MFSGAFGLPHLLIILVILLLLFGAPKLPALAKSVAQSMKIFKTEIGPNNSGSTESGTDAPSNGTTVTNADGSTTTTVTTPAPTNGTTPLSTDKTKP